MTVIPFTEILLYITLFFAPANATQIEMKDPSGAVIVFTESAGGWEAEAGDVAWPDARWTMQNGELHRGVEPIALDDYVSGVDEHEWCEESILPVHDSMEVLKTSSGFLIYPEGIEQPENKFVVTYVTESEGEETD